MDILEWLVPIIFVVIWLARKFFGKEEDDSEAAPGQEAERRKQEIQEEIRRRIAERQQDRGTVESPAPPSAGRAPPAPPVRQLETAVKEIRGPDHHRGDSPFVVVETPHPAMQQPSSAGLQAQMDQLRQGQLASLHTAMENTERVRQRQQISEVIVHDGLMERQALRNAVKDPDSLKRAFVYAEVLGIPLSLRRRSGFMQFWEE